MASYETPGVYIDEDASLALSVSSSATAVPVFAHNKNLLQDDGKAIRIRSWLDFLNLEKKNVVPIEKDTLYLSLKTYFDNGGGYCYVCPTDQLEKDVLGLDEVTLIVASGESITAKFNLLLQKRKDIFAILDGPKVSLNTSQVDMKDYPSSNYAAVYYPWLQADWASQRNGDTKTFYDIPPSAAVAGAYCRVDRERGVWKAPANVELTGVWPKEKVSDAVQGPYNKNDKALNMIREFHGTGPLIWGARTLKGNDPRWGYVPVRRLFNAAEKDIKKAMHTAVFEPNSHPTWEKARAAIDTYLYSLWRLGGLMGVKPEEAYFVQIGKGVTMTQEQINAGKMIVKVGMAAVRPAEFIILQFTQDMAAAA